MFSALIVIIVSSTNAYFGCGGLGWIRPRLTLLSWRGTVVGWPGPFPRSAHSCQLLPHLIVAASAEQASVSAAAVAILVSSFFTSVFLLLEAA